MINQSNICVFDFETTGKDPRSCEPIQIAACILEPRNLSIISEYNSYIRLDDMSLFSPEIQNLTGIKREQLENAPEQKIVWSSFVEYVKNAFNYDGPRKLRPVMAGHNIVNYDCHIIDRLCEKYKTKDIFNIFKIDTMQLTWLWFENTNDLSNLKLSAVLEKFGIENDGAHNAMNDVRANVKMIVKYMQLHRKLYKKIVWNGAVGV